MSFVCGWTLMLAWLLACYFRLTSGQGFLHTPMGRGTVGYPKSLNPYHMSNNCGGVTVQKASGGKCGVCGDPWDGPRKHEVGGQYATGKITGSYSAGAVIPVTVHVTRGYSESWIEFRLCPVTNPKIEVTQQCLNQNLLQFEDGKTSRIVSLGDSLRGWINTKLKLPDNITCSHCVLQWKYYADGWLLCLGGGILSPSCGQQMEVYNCADITISRPSPLPASSSPKTNSATQPTVVKPTVPTPSASSFPRTNSATQPTVVKPAVAKPSASSSPKTNSATQPAVVKPTVAKPSGKCVPIGNWVTQPGMFTWCADNCARGHCPADMCAC